MLWHFLVSAPDTRLKHRVPKNKIDFLSCLTTIHPFYLEAHLVAWTWNRICVKRSLIIRQDSNWILCTVYYISYNAHFRGKYGFVEYKVRHFPHLTLPLVQNIYSMYPCNMCSSYLHQLYICLDYIIILLWKVRAMGTWIFRVLLFPILACMPYCMNISEQTNKQTSSSHKVHCAIIAVCICEEEVSLAYVYIKYPLLIAYVQKKYPFLLGIDRFLSYLHLCVHSATTAMCFQKTFIYL